MVKVWVLKCIKLVGLMTIGSHNGDMSFLLLY